MIKQNIFHLSAKRRGCHLVTDEILANLPKPLPQVGMLNLFLQHTSCALSINENYDPDVRTDMESILNHMVKEKEPYYEHTMEGPDDMPAHAKSSLFGVSLTIPITDYVYGQEGHKNCKECNCNPPPVNFRKTLEHFVCKVCFLKQTTSNCSWQTSHTARTASRKSFTFLIKRLLSISYIRKIGFIFSVSYHILKKSMEIHLRYIL